MIGACISGDSQAIVGYDRGFGPAALGQGTIWIEGQGMRNLSSYVTAQGVDLQGGAQALPPGLSADGSTIYGVGNTGSGFVVTLSPVPEPVSVAMLTAGPTLCRRAGARERATH